MGIIVLLGRILFSAIFVMGGFNHFSADSVQYAAAAGVPQAGWLVPLAGVIAIVGGISIILGLKARLGAVLIIIFLIPVTLMMHQFWNAEDQLNATIERIMFFKNISMLGGALIIAYFGSGPLSLTKS